ncbi:MAG: hypothetical protein J6Z13_02865 [Clostridia bacterium]|nr:hypothetical protein [Clostridia bacterium]
MKTITKLFAAYKAGYLGDNIFDTYFSFVANMLIDEKVMIVEDSIVAEKLKERYAIELPLPFIRQVLGIGVQNNCFVEDHGKYRVDLDKLSLYRFNDSDFNALWSRLLNEFSSYCDSNGVIIVSSQLEEFVLCILDDTDDKILSGEKVEKVEGMPACEYAWYNFIKEQGENNTDLYSFVSALSASNITKQALFFAGETSVDYSGLNVYLDSPIVFALLGMDEDSRTSSYKTLVSDMQKAKCNVCVLDHNLQEVDSIITRAAGWAISTHYDLNKANNAARFFHDSQMSDTEISEFCESIETKLNDLGITVKETNYDVLQDKFQEDEIVLFDMIKKRYLENKYELPPEKEDTIRIDVRSIIMIYRERQGQTSTRIQNAKHIMLTSNNVIANVSKQYESNRSIYAGHIPACVSADLFGAILWLDSPVQMLEYQKQKLLADCYAFLRPDKRMIEKYIQSLDEARRADEIDEKKYLFLRTHKVVLDSLMNITKGDYARFNSRTYLEVYDDIEARSLKRYSDEVSAHNKTKQELRELEDSSAKKIIEQDEIIKELQARVDSYEDKEQKDKEILFEKRVKQLGWLLTLFFIGIPYIAVLVTVELLKMRFTTVSWTSVWGIAGLVIATFLAAAFWLWGRKKCFAIIRSFLTKRENQLQRKI